jgi:antitoxin component YwqK of YwqJK toxin-antitoxin module
VTYSNGKKYIGNWKDGKQHGNGAEVYPDGKVVKGIWKDGELFEVQ